MVNQGHWAVGHHSGERVQSGEMEKRERWDGSWAGERRIWRGEGGKELAEVNGQLAN